VIDLVRRRAVRPAPTDSPVNAAEDTVAKIPDPASPDDDARWQREWENALMALALERVAQRADPQSVNVFRQYVLEERSPQEVAEQFGLSVNAVYLIKNRMIAYLREEIAKLEAAV
jgi:DNA-directed RNA polymerase specialized sigma24 family protein